MIKNLIEILACPICKGSLELKIIKEDAGEVIIGELRCLNCPLLYSVEDTIPILLPPEPSD